MSTTSVENAWAGMGPILHESGVAFRVWAPHADAVCVAGSFNGWSTNAHPMAKEGDGYWYADIDSAAVGDEYRYLIVNGDKRLLRIWERCADCQREQRIGEQRGTVYFLAFPSPVDVHLHRLLPCLLPSSLCLIGVRNFSGDLDYAGGNSGRKACAAAPAIGRGAGPR